MVVSFANLCLMEFWVKHFALFCISQQYKASSHSGWEPSQEYAVNPSVPQGYILSLTLFLLYINNLPDDVICNIAIYAADTTLV